MGKNNNDPITKAVDDLEAKGLIEIDRPCKVAKGKDVSKNDAASAIVGMRNRGTPLFGPCELGYVCPICGAGAWKRQKDGTLEPDGVDERITWSEYNGFIYCYKCNMDIPSCLCKKFSDLYAHKFTKKEFVKQATDIYLACVKEATERAMDKAALNIQIAEAHE